MKSSNQRQIAIDTRILREIESSDIFFNLSFFLKKYFRYYVPVEKERLRDWLGSCDINFQQRFKTFFNRYPSRIQYSPSRFQNWDEELEKYTSVNDFDSLIQDLNGIMVQNLKSLEDYQDFSSNITREGLYLSSQTESFASLLAAVQTFSESTINPGQNFDDIWLERFHDLMCQCVEIDIIDQHSFAEGGPDLGLFFQKIEEHNLKYSKLDKINFIFDDTNYQKRKAKDFIDSKRLEMRYDINLVPIPRHEVRQAHERYVIFYFTNDRSYGLALDTGLPFNLYKTEIQKHTTASLKDLEAIDSIVKKCNLWIERFSLNL